MHKNSNINDELQEFVAGKDNHVPTQAHARILHHVKAELQPAAVLIFAKLLVVQAVMGVMTLLFCPQFELSLTNSVELFHYFHHTYGASVCMLICGAIFTAPGAVFAAYLLKTAEVHKVKRAGLHYHLAIAGVALLAFFLCGADVFNQLTLFWFTAAALTATLLFDLNLWLRPLVLQSFGAIKTKYNLAD